MPFLLFTFRLPSVSTSLLLFVSCIPQTLAHFLQARTDLVPLVELSAVVWFLLNLRVYWFYLRLVAWDDCLHPATIPESSASLVGLLVQDPDSLSLSGHISVLRRPSPDLVKMGCLTPRGPRAFLSVCLGTIFLYNHSPS